MHFHYVLSLGAVIAVFAGFYYWAPKISAKMYNESLARIHFWGLFVGVNNARWLRLISKRIHYLSLWLVLYNKSIWSDLKECRYVRKKESVYEEEYNKGTSDSHDPDPEPGP